LGRFRAGTLYARDCGVIRVPGGSEGHYFLGA
jgi:hypothetical protein